MEGIQILIYIVVAVIYLIIKGMNKTAKPDNSGLPGESTATPSAEPPANLPPRKKAPFSLKDLLNEFGESTKKKIEEQKNQQTVRTKEATRNQEKARQSVTGRSRQLQQNAKTVFKNKSEEKTNYEAPFTYENTNTPEYVPEYENKANEVDYDIPGKSTYAGLDDQKRRFEAFEISSAKKKPATYAQLLKDPQSVRTAFILSEIFKRKYE